MTKLLTACVCQCNKIYKSYKYNQHKLSFLRAATYTERTANIMNTRYTTQNRNHISIYSETSRPPSNTVGPIYDVNKLSSRKIKLDKYSFNERNFFYRYLISCASYNAYVLENQYLESKKLLQEKSLGLRLFSKEDLVVFMYYASRIRVLPNIKSSDLTETISKYIYTFSLEELAIISLGMFKTQTKLDDTLIPSFSQRLCDVTPSTDSRVLGSVLKILKFSTNRSSIRLVDPNFRSAILHSLDNFATIMHSYSPSTITTLLQFYGRLRIMSEEFSKSLLDHFSSDESIAQSRVKDIQRLAFNCGHFLLLNCDVMERLLGEMKAFQRRDELFAYPAELVKFLIGLSYVNIYDEELTELVLSRQFTDALSDNEENDMLRDLYQLYMSVSIDRPARFTPPPKPGCLSAYEEELREYDRCNRSNTHQHGGPATTREGIVLDVRDIVMDAVKTGYVYVRSLLPHYATQDIELCLDSQLHPVPIDRLYPTQVRKDAFCRQNTAEPSDPTRHRIAVVIHGPTSYYMYYRGGVRERRLLGLHAMKERQLGALGYLVVPIPFTELRDSRDKVVYMTNKLHACIGNSTKTQRHDCTDS